MNFSNLANRLLALENKSAGRDAVLHFSDGTSRSLRIADPLGCLLASFQHIHARIEGEAAPAGEHDRVLTLLGRADEIESNDSLLKLLHEESRKAVVL